MNILEIMFRIKAGDNSVVEELKRLKKETPREFSDFYHKNSQKIKENLEKAKANGTIDVKKIPSAEAIFNEINKLAEPVVEKEAEAIERIASPVEIEHLAPIPESEKPIFHEKIKPEDWAEMPSGRLIPIQQIPIIEKYFSDQKKSATPKNKYRRLDRDLKTEYSVIQADDSQMYALYKGKNNALGKGNMGQAKLAQNIKTGEWVAIKIQKESIVNIKAENAITKKVGLLKATMERTGGNTGKVKKFYSVQPLLTGTQLSRTETITLNSFFQLSKNLLQELNGYHEQGIVHKDIHAGNIMYDPKTAISRIIDFGLSRDIQDVQSANEKSKWKEYIKKDRLHLIQTLKDTLNNNLMTSERDAHDAHKMEQLSAFFQNILKSNNSEDIDIKIILESIQDISLGTTHQAENSTLILAASNGHTTKVNALIAILTDINLVDENNDSALMLAARNGHKEIINTLIAMGAKVNLVDANGDNALMLVARKGHTEIARILIKNEADIKLVNKNGDSALTLAARYGHAEIAQTLISNGADITLMNKNGDSALILAAYNGHATTVKTLISMGADVNQVDSEGNSALILAAHRNHVATVNTLISMGADVNLVNNEGNSAFMLAVHNGDTKIVNTLIDAGANINLVNKSGDNALIIAMRNGDTELVKSLKASALKTKKSATLTPQLNTFLEEGVKVKSKRLKTESEIDVINLNNPTSPTNTRGG